jgi:hypothetical protein
MTYKVKGLVRWLEDEPWPKCPHCLDAEPLDLRLPDLRDGETDEIECSHCGRAYEIKARVRPTFDCHPRGEKP